ncbi:MAG: hypothetical protein QNK04_23925 [Myxococcota bacterium]|nr:hypothetical protein [Myxococcota bacterium]
MEEIQQTLAPGAFKHVVVPIGVVIGLGVGRIVMMMSNYAADRGRVRFSAVHTLWSALLFIMFLGVWWIVWGLSQVPAERWSFFALVYLVTGPVLIYLPSILLLPDLPERGSLDLGDVFDRLGAPVLLCMAGFVIWLACAELYLLREPFLIPKRANQAVIFGAFMLGSAFPSRRMAGVMGSVALGATLVALATLRAQLI